MGVKGAIEITDSGTATLKNLRKETKALSAAVKETKSELKEAFDKRYKPVIDSSAASRHFQELKVKKNEFKEAAVAKLHLETPLDKLRIAKEKLKAFGNMVVSPVISIKDKGISTIQTINSKLLAIGNRVITPVVKVKDNITSGLSKIKKELGFIGRTIAKPAVVLKDNITSKLSSIGGKMKAMGSKVTKPVISILDKTSSGIGKIGGKLASIGKSLAIPVTVAATVATAALGASIKSGMDLESQQISMNHFIGATNKDMSTDQVKEAADTFTNALRENANATPFETGEVIKAGSRAVAITQGNTDEAMSLVKLSEDMAAASGGTASVADAMEALADAKMGEMERLKSFGFKVSAEEFKSKGFAGVSSDLEDFFGGASAKLAESGSGLMSTITGKLKSGVSDFGLGIVNELKPVLVDIIGFVDKAMPVIQELGKSFASSLGSGIGFIKENMPSIISAVNKVMPPIVAFAESMKTNFMSIANAVAPVIGTIGSVIQQLLPVVMPILTQIQTIFTNIAVAVMPPVQAAIQGIGAAFIAIAPVVSSVLDGISAVVGNVIGGITGIIQGGMDLISSIWSGDWQGVCDSFGTIMGGLGEICKAPINAIIGIINGAISAINSVSIDTPDWLPFGWGGQHLGFDLGEIPYLAKGGVVNSATPAVFGEAGKEAVVPLERNVGWMDPVAHRMASMLKGSTPQEQPAFAVVDHIASMLRGLIPQAQPAFAVAGGGGDVYNININIDKLDVDGEDEEKIEKVGSKLAKEIIEALKNR